MLRSRALARLQRLRSRPSSPWTEILAADASRRSNEVLGRRVLFGTSVGSHPIAPTVDSLVAMALWLRGAQPTLLLCDGALPACEACSYTALPRPDEFGSNGPQRRLCAPCFSTGSAFYHPLPLPLRRYREFVSSNEIQRAIADASSMSLEDAFSFEENGLRLGEQARAGVLRFFGKADLSSEPEGLVRSIARRYAAGARVAAIVAERIMDELEPECIVAHHGVYVPQGVLGEVARRDGVRVVHWGTSYRNTTVIFSHDDTYHRTFLTDPVAAWDDRSLSEAQEEDLMQYLRARRRGEGDWTWITPEAALRAEVPERTHLLEELGIHPERPTAGLLTNVFWDAQLHYEGHAFRDMLDWLWTTLDFFFAHPNYQLIVRIHPHEVKRENRQPVEPLIRSRYPALPSNIKIVPYDHPYNTYALMDLCDAVLIYGTKTGVELAPAGVPVVVAGEAWVRGKGFTYDVESRADYLDLLDGLARLERLDAEKTARARRYAYDYFFRRMIPLSSISPDGGVPPTLTVESLDDLAPGRDPGLDVICAGILEGHPFIFDGES